MPSVCSFPKVHLPRNFMSEKFDIRKFVTLDDQSRAACPACALSKGTTYSNKNLSVFPGQTAGIWAYKCYRGCTKEEIRDALGERADRIIPTAIATPPPKATQLTPLQVNQSHDKLLTSNNCLALQHWGGPIEGWQGSHPGDRHPNSHIGRSHPLLPEKT
jgi:hypothetical protein